MKVFSALLLAFLLTLTLADDPNHHHHHAHTEEEDLADLPSAEALVGQRDFLPKPVTFIEKSASKTIPETEETVADEPAKDIPEDSRNEEVVPEQPSADVVESVAPSGNDEAANERTEKVALQNPSSQAVPPESTAENGSVQAIFPTVILKADEVPAPPELREELEAAPAESYQVPETTPSDSYEVPTTTVAPPEESYQVPETTPSDSYEVPSTTVAPEIPSEPDLEVISEAPQPPFEWVETNVVEETPWVETSVVEETPAPWVETNVVEEIVTAAPWVETEVLHASPIQTFQPVVSCVPSCTVECKIVEKVMPFQRPMTVCTPTATHLLWKRSADSQPDAEPTFGKFHKKPCFVTGGLGRWRRDAHFKGGKSKFSSCVERAVPPIVCTQKFITEQKVIPQKMCFNKCHQTC